MKVRNLIIPMVAMLMLMAGCGKEHYAVVDTYQFNVNPADWMRNEGANLPGANNYLYCDVTLPAIDQEVFQNGTVQVYCWNVYDTQNNLGAWNTLPFVYPLEVYVTDEITHETNRIIVPENLRFEWELGKLTLVIQDLDGYDPESMELAGPISFKVAITRNI